MLGRELASARAKSLRVGAALGGGDDGKLAGAAALILLDGGARRVARLGSHRGQGRLVGLPSAARRPGRQA